MSEFAEPGYPGKIRQPMMLVAAGRDQIVSTPAIENSRSGCAPARISSSPARSTK